MRRKNPADKTQRESTAMEKENDFFVDSNKLSPGALKKKHWLETDPSRRTNHMEYMPGMEIIESDVQKTVLSQMNDYDYNAYSERDVRNALEHETCSIEDFKALLSPVAGAVFGADGSARAQRNRKTFREHRLYFHASLHRKLLFELLRLLRV